MTEALSEQDSPLSASISAECATTCCDRRRGGPLPPVNPPCTPYLSDKRFSWAGDALLSLMIFLQRPRETLFETKSKRDQFMRSHLVWCLRLNIFAALLALALLFFYPTLRGFTITTATRKRFVQGGPLLASLLLIRSSFLIAAYLAFRVCKVI